MISSEVVQSWGALRPWARPRHRGAPLNLIAMASNLVGMVSHLIAMASNLLAMSSQEHVCRGSELRSELVHSWRRARRFSYRALCAATFMAPLVMGWHTPRYYVNANKSRHIINEKPDPSDTATQSMVSLAHRSLFSSVLYIAPSKQTNSKGDLKSSRKRGLVASLLLVAMPGAPSRVLVPSSKARGY